MTKLEIIVELTNRLNLLRHKEVVALLSKDCGIKLNFDPYRKGLPNSGQGYFKGDTKKTPFINWAIENHYVALKHHFKLTNEFGEEKKPTDPKPQPQPKPIETPKKQIDFSNLQKVFEEIFEQNSQSVDREEVKEIVEGLIAPAVKEAIQNIQPQIIVVDKHKKVEYKVEGAVNKEVFEKCLKLATTAPNPNIMIVGPAGSGKTQIVEQIADAMGRKFVTLSVTAGISESHLTGWLLPVGDNGKFIHLDAPFLKAYEEGNAVILLDEMDSADPNVLLCINQALANGGFTVAQRHEKSYVKRGENVAIFGACNTWGSGADHRYTGRESLDLSSLDRFHMVAMDYDRKMESALCGQNHIILEWANHVRKGISTNSLDRIFSTRKVLEYYQMIEGGQWSIDEIKKLYFASWSKDDKALVS